MLRSCASLSPTRGDATEWSRAYILVQIMPQLRTCRADLERMRMGKHLGRWIPQTFDYPNDPIHHISPISVPTPIGSNRLIPSAVSFTCQISSRIGEVRMSSTWLMMKTCWNWSFAFVIVPSISSKR